MGEGAAQGEGRWRGWEVLGSKKVITLDMRRPPYTRRISRRAKGTHLPSVHESGEG